MGFELMALCDLASRSNYWATGDSMVSRGEIWVWKQNRAFTKPNGDLAHINALINWIVQPH